MARTITCSGPWRLPVSAPRNEYFSVKFSQLRYKVRRLRYINLAGAWLSWEFYVTRCLLRCKKTFRQSKERALFEAIFVNYRIHHNDIMTYAHILVTLRFWPSHFSAEILLATEFPQKLVVVHLRINLEAYTLITETLQNFPLLLFYRAFSDMIIPTPFCSALSETTQWYSQYICLEPDLITTRDSKWRRQTHNK